MASSWGLSWSNSWGNSWGLAASTRDTHDGEDYKRYRKYLERLARATEFKDKRKFTKLREIAEEIVEEIPLPTPEIKKLTLPKPKIDYEALSREIERVKRFISQQEMKRMDEELALILLL